MSGWCCGWMLGMVGRWCGRLLGMFGWWWFGWLGGGVGGGLGCKGGGVDLDVSSIFGSSDGVCAALAAVGGDGSSFTGSDADGAGAGLALVDGRGLLGGPLNGGSQARLGMGTGLQNG